MPAHDWTRVNAGTFHDFHLAWIAELRTALNGGLLPTGYYAMAEQRAAEFEPDLLALEFGGDRHVESEPVHEGGGTAVAVAPPKATLIGAVDESALYALKRRSVVIRHSSDDRIVALVELASPGNKDRRQSVQSFVDKAVASLQFGYHLVVIDLFPPRAGDPAGLGSAVWEEMRGQRIHWPAGKPLTATSFQVTHRLQCYGEAFAPGDQLPDIPLFYNPEWYVNLPLEATYTAAYEGVPRRWKRVIEGLD